MKKNNPKVTVIIATYNQKSYLKQAINSVIKQTYSNYELIISDDASTDGTEMLCRAYERKYPSKIKYVRSNEHAGFPAKVRNHGLKLMTGDFFCYLDHDDLLPSSSLAERVLLYRDFADEKLGMVFSDQKHFLTTWSLLGRFLRKERYRKLEKIIPKRIILVLIDFMRRILPWQQKNIWIEPDYHQSRKETIIELFSKEYNRSKLLATLKEQQIASGNTMLIPAAVLLQVGLFDESYHSAEDLELFCRIAKKYDIKYIDKPLYFKRHHSDRLKRVDEAKRVFDAMKEI